MPLVPVILGILLGEQMEKNLRRALTISDGNLNILWDSPLAMSLLAAAVFGFIVPIVWGRLFRVRQVLDKQGDEATGD